MSESGVREFPAEQDLMRFSSGCVFCDQLLFHSHAERQAYHDNGHVIPPKFQTVEFKVTQRKYLPTLSDLVDRLAIVQLKAINIPERSEEYAAERGLIEHDIDLILKELAGQGKQIGASEVHAILVIMLSNHFIWINETKARQGGSEQDKLLKMTHSINGVRNTAKNQLANVDGGRRDYKVDCFAAELVADFGNWNIW